MSLYCKILLPSPRTELLFTCASHAFHLEKRQCLPHPAELHEILVQQIIDVTNEPVAFQLTDEFLLYAEHGNDGQDVLQLPFYSFRIPDVDAIAEVPPPDFENRYL